jgi:hypothetical protein
MRQQVYLSANRVNSMQSGKNAEWSFVKRSSAGKCFGLKIDLCQCGGCSESPAANPRPKLIKYLEKIFD